MEDTDTRYGPDGYQMDLRATNLQAVDITRLNFKKARLQGARLKGAILMEARMEGAFLDSIKLSQSTDLKADANHASAFRSVDFTGMQLSENFLTSAFGDASVTLPEGYSADEGVLAHWKANKLSPKDFRDAWHKWQDDIGYRRP